MMLYPCGYQTETTFSDLIGYLNNQDAVFVC